MSSKGSDNVKTKYTFEGKQLFFCFPVWFWIIFKQWEHSIIHTLDSTALLYKPLDRVMKTTLVLHVRYCLRSQLTFIYKYSSMPMDLLTFFSVLLRICGSTHPLITPTASRCRKRFVSPAASCLGSMNGRSANVLSSLAEERYSHTSRDTFLHMQIFIKLYY